MPYKAKVCFIVEWVKQETGESAAVILPEIWLKKNGEKAFPDDYNEVKI